MKTRTTNSQGGTVKRTVVSGNGSVTEGDRAPIFPAPALPSKTLQRDHVPEVEKGIPIPKLGRRSHYPFDEMKIGDSFWAPVSSSSVLTNAANKHSQSLALTRKYTARIEPRGGVKGARIWRTE